LGGGVLDWQPSSPEVLDFVRPHPDGGVRCVVNLGSNPLRLPAGAVLLSSAVQTGDILPPDTAVWLRA
jgi:alpha-glucosidase